MGLVDLRVLDTRVVYLKNNDLYIYIQKTPKHPSETKQLTHDAILKSLPVLSKDGKQIAYLQTVSSTIALANLIIVGENGEPLHNILLRPATDSYADGMGPITSLQWISEHRIALSGNINPTTAETIILDIRTQQEIRTDFDDLLGAEFSSDGSDVAYIAF